VSANNPDVAWLREAELKHGRMSMLAITGVMVQSAGIHLPGNADISFANADWAMAPTTLPPAAWGQVLFFIGAITREYPGIPEITRDPWGQLLFVIGAHTCSRPPFSPTPCP